MAKRIFTEEQEAAITERGRNLLVSAAAGSGKTATLIERIVRSLKREEEPEEINRILIVTFTVSATAEIKERISKELRAALEEAENKAQLERQLTLLPMAKIFTIDAFCNNIIKRNSDKAGISPSYRIADGAEAEILSRSLLSSLVEALYNGLLPEIASAEEFAALVENLTASKKNSALEDVLLSLYAKTKSLLDGISVYERMADEYKNGNPCENQYTKYILNRLHELGAHYKEAVPAFARTLAPEFYDIISSVVASDTALAESLSRAESFEEAAALIGNKKKYHKMPPISDKEDDSYCRWNAFRTKAFKHDIDEFADKFFFYSNDEWRELYRGLGEKLSVLASVLTEFDRIYMLEKKRRAMFEHSDIARFAYEALWNGDEKSEIALALANEFSSVYIDEYQDVNPLQDKIFEAVSRGDNRFMVGDIKQSIYAFRSADPDVFAEMKRSYPSLEGAKRSGAKSASIFMSKNFRSDSLIIDFINGVFDRAFGLTRERIDYVDADRLTAGKINPEGAPPPRNPEFILVSSPKEESGKSGAREDESLLLSRNCCTEVAKRIAELLKSGRLNSGERIQPRDIAILLRGNARMGEYAEALEALGIPSQKRDNKNFFLNKEILLALSLLNAIDNPERDIYLVSAMLSPIFGFTADEIALLRFETAGERSLFKSLKLYCAAHPEFKKGSRFLEQLSFYRTLAEGMNVDSFIRRLYNDTDILKLSHGHEEHLLLLYEYAKSFSASNFKGLYNFIKFINNIISSKTKFQPKRDDATENAVTLTTVHSSKGLEYPVVFYADTETQIKYQDSGDRVMFSPKFGMSLRLRTKSGLALINNPIQNVIIDYETRKNYDEELRVIYVALTRAREALYIVANIPEQHAEFLMNIEEKRALLNAYSLYKLNSPVKMMLASYDITTAKRSVVEYLTANSAPAIEDGEDDGRSAEPVGKAVLPTKEELRERLSFVYPEKFMTELPEKLSISRLYPAVLDGTERESTRLELEPTPAPPPRRGILPDFITGTASDESAKRGIATHTFLQFFDIASLDELGTEGELERLVSEGFISAEDRERVRVDELRLFEGSELLSEMRNAKGVLREFRFTTELPARYFTKNPERREALRDEVVLTQGVIDCLIETENGELRLVDYKTDRLTKAELANPELAEQTLSEKHSLQLSYYALAIREIFGREVKDLRVYSLPLGKTVSIERRSFEE